MTNVHLINDFWTIVLSGTRRLMQAIEEGMDIPWNNQLSIVIFSAFLVSDRVVMTSVHADSNQYFWDQEA